MKEYNSAGRPKSIALENLTTSSLMSGSKYAYIDLKNALKHKRTLTNEHTRINQERCSTLSKKTLQEYLSPQALPAKINSRTNPLKQD